MSHVRQKLTSVRPTNLEPGPLPRHLASGSQLDLHLLDIVPPFFAELPLPPLEPQAVGAAVNPPKALASTTPPATAKTTASLTGQMCRATLPDHLHH